MHVDSSGILRWHFPLSMGNTKMGPQRVAGGPKVMAGAGRHGQDGGFQAKSGAQLLGLCVGWGI